MSSLPRVEEHTRERIAREFDSLGPDVCVVEISRELGDHNPELLEMATKCATDVGDPAEIMVGFCMFYRLLIVQSGAQMRTCGKPVRKPDSVHFPVSRRTPAISSCGKSTGKGRTRLRQDSIEELERSNPELLQMAHNFASRHADYLGIMQGFALLYRSLVAQAREGPDLSAVSSARGKTQPSEVAILPVGVFIGTLRTHHYPIFYLGNAGCSPRGPVGRRAFRP